MPLATILQRLPKGPKAQFASDENMLHLVLFAEELPASEEAVRAEELK